MTTLIGTTAKPARFTVDSDSPLPDDAAAATPQNTIERILRRESTPVALRQNDVDFQLTRGLLRVSA